MLTPPSTIQAALLAPIVRVWRGAKDETAATTVLGMLAFLYDPVFWFGIVILFGFSAVDWVVGTRVAVSSRRFEGARAYNGVISKIVGIFMAFGLRAYAEYLKAEGTSTAAELAGSLVHVGGVGFTAALIAGEIRSITINQVRLTGSSPLMPVVRIIDRLLGIDKHGADIATLDDIDSEER